MRHDLPMIHRPPAPTLLALYCLLFSKSLSFTSLCGEAAWHSAARGTFWSSQTLCDTGRHLSELAVCDVTRLLFDAAAGKIKGFKKSEIKKNIWKIKAKATLKHRPPAYFVRDFSFAVKNSYKSVELLKTSAHSHLSSDPDSLHSKLFVLPLSTV